MQRNKDRCPNKVIFTSHCLSEERSHPPPRGLSAVVKILQGSLRYQTKYAVYSCPPILTVPASPTQPPYHKYHTSEQVRGYCKDESNPGIFDDVNVYGNIYDSDIHHNHFGVYTYGHQQGDWRRNKMHDNSGYGFDPHDDSDFLTIHDNEVYNNCLLYTSPSPRD